MIFYFSGTGNSKYVAGRIASVTGEPLFSINNAIKNGNHTVDSLERFVFVVPTYAWRIPKIVGEWIDDTSFQRGKAWFVMTCGGETGNAAKYNRLLCERKGFTYMGTAQIVMPENYITMFNAPERAEAEKMIAAAGPDILRAAEQIKAGEAFPRQKNNPAYSLMSSVINPVFYRFFVKADPFYAKEVCNGCGACVRLCPLNNITLKAGKPVWGKDCTQCMACICSCPKEAIEYGKKSIDKPRYRCPE